MDTKELRGRQLAPDQTPLSESQATILSSLTGIEAASFRGLSVAEIATKFRWQIDPDLFLFVRVCGQVVKADPNSGQQEPVPFATVYAEETTCSLMGRFPIDLPWAWFFPFGCRTQEVAQTTTDACGNFCIWIPRFEIEWILRFRIERICYLPLFSRPTVKSVLAYLEGSPASARQASHPSAAVNLTRGTALYQKAEQLLGTQVTRQLAALSGNKAFGSVNPSQQALLSRPAFPTRLPPPLPKEFRKKAGSGSPEKHREAVKSTLANNLGISVNQLRGFDLNNYFGPYLRCFDVIVPEWVPIFEVPDISFRVTQDVNGNGVQEVIYSGGLFDVPWGVNNISNVTLLASPIATSVSNCNTPNVPCGNVPSLEFAGLMPLVNPPSPAAPYIDPVAGYATRPNPPHPGGTLGEAGVPPATAPYTRTLQLYGCTQVSDAAFYRLRYTFTQPGGITPSALTPFTGLTWPLSRVVGGVLQEQWPVADSNGWYPVIAASEDWFPNSLVLEWDTVNSAIHADGLYTIQLEVADTSKTLLATSTPIGFVVDNTAPIFTYSGVWSFASDFSGAQPLPTTDCVVIDRGASPQDVYVQLTYSVSAQNLRSVQVGSSGCAGGATLISALSTVQHWYEDAADNTFSSVATFKIPAGQPAGVYGFDLYADTRAFNPAGGDAGPVDDWNYNPPDYFYNYTDPSFAIAVVDA